MESDKLAYLNVNINLYSASSQKAPLMPLNLITLVFA